jgi:GNAT superfamily N-acetyltransferase
VAELILLQKSHDRRRFDCGSQELNSFLQQTARQHLEKGLSTTHVLIEDDGKTIKGFYTLTLCEVEGVTLPEDFSKKLPPERIPAVLLARLGVDLSFQKQGLGKALLIEAIRDAVRVIEKGGGIGLFVDAKDEAAKSFYEALGFVALPGQPRKLFLPVKTLRQVVSGVGDSA